MKAVGRDEAVATPRSLWSSGSRTGRSGILINIHSFESESSEDVEQPMDDIASIAREPSVHCPGRSDIAREPSLHLPSRQEGDRNGEWFGRRSTDLLVAGRTTTEKILSSFGYSYTGQSAAEKSCRSCRSPSHPSHPSRCTHPSPLSPLSPMTSHPSHHFTSRTSRTSRSSRSPTTRTSVQSTRTNPPSLPSLEAKPSARNVSWRLSGVGASWRSRKGRFWSRCCGCVTCVAVLALLSGVALLLFWPRTPEFLEVRKLESDQRLMDLVTALSSDDLVGIPSQLFFAAEALISNPNLLHGDVSEGSLELRYDGELVATGVSGASTLAPRTTSSIFANVTLDLEQGFVKMLQERILAERWLLEFNLKSACKVMSILNIHLQHQMVCDLQVTLVDLMMSETRSRAVTVKSCKHSLS